jgi:hypothetical protein
MTAKPENIQQTKSGRFSPRWNPGGGEGISGIINLVSDIYNIDQHCHTWVEIGTLYGESSLLIASFPFVKKLHCIDMRMNQNLDMVKKRLKHLMGVKQIELIHDSSTNASKKFKESEIDAIYIDGNHEYQSVTEDLSYWFSKIKSNGFICGHDYGPRWPGVIQAVDEFCASHNQKIIKRYCDSSWMIRKSI